MLHGVVPVQLLRDLALPEDDVRDGLLPLLGESVGLLRGGRAAPVAPEVELLPPELLEDIGVRGACGDDQHSLLHGLLDLGERRDALGDKPFGLGYCEYNLLLHDYRVVCLAGRFKKELKGGVRSSRMRGGWP